MNFAEFQTQDRRLVQLKALEAAVNYHANAYLLRRFCESLGHSVGTDLLKQDLAWLAVKNLVTVAEVQGVTVATLTERGLDVAMGRVQVPGVARPQPGG